MAVKTRSDEAVFRSSDYRRLPLRPVACACCGGSDLHFATRGDRYFFGLETVVCNACGLIFTCPRPEDGWFEDFYRLHYRRFYESTSVPDSAYLCQESIQHRHARTLSRLAPHLGDTGTLLDMGCAEGTFLYLFGQRFARWRLLGIEPSEEFSAFAREHYGIEGVVTGDLKEVANWEEDTLDLVVASHVLEHLLDPNVFFRTAHHLLKPGALLSLEVPDAEGQRRGVQNLHVAHVYHFSERSLGNFLTKHGFEVVWARKGEERPHPWTIQLLARTTEAPPENWTPPPVDAVAVARAFASLCRSSPGSLLLRRLKQRRRERMAGGRQQSAVEALVNRNA
jgi:SAM-dependent methyltransferase